MKHSILALLDIIPQPRDLKTQHNACTVVLDIIVQQCRHQHLFSAQMVPTTISLVLQWLALSVLLVLVAQLPMFMLSFVSRVLTV
jgi:hypothetical protein